MPMERKNIFLVIALVLAVLAFALCIPFLFNPSKNVSSDVVTIKFVYAFQNAQWNSQIEDLIGRFEDENPDIKIDYTTHYEDTVYENFLNKLIARDELGDVLQLKMPYSYVNEGYIAELPENVRTLVTDDNLYYVNDTPYALGAVNTTSGVLYNKEIFESLGLTIPSNYDEFINICETLKANGQKAIGCAGVELWHMEYLLNHYFRSDVLSKDPDWLKKCARGECSWNDEEIYNMFSHMKNLFEQGYVEENWLSVKDGSLPYMMSHGDIAMIYTGPWTAKIVASMDNKVETGWFYLPDDDGNIYIDENKDTYFAITSSCAEDEKKLEAACKFLEFIYEENNYEELYRGIYSFPTTDNTKLENLSGIEEQIYSGFENNENHIYGFIGNEDTPEGFENDMLIEISNMLSNKQSIETTMQNCEILWDKYEAED